MPLVSSLSPAGPGTEQPGTRNRARWCRFSFPEAAPGRREDGEASGGPERRCQHRRVFVIESRRGSAERCCSALGACCPDYAASEAAAAPVGSTLGPIEDGDGLRACFRPQRPGSALRVLKMDRRAQAGRECSYGRDLLVSGGESE